MSTGQNDPFQQSTALSQVVLRKLAHIKWSVRRLVENLEQQLKRKKNCSYWNCPECFCGGEVKLRYAMTAYHWDKESGKPNPNPDFMACDNHFEVYAAHWNEMWDEYYSSQGYPRKR